MYDEAGFYHISFSQKKKNQGSRSRHGYGYGNWQGINDLQRWLRTVRTEIRLSNCKGFSLNNCLRASDLFVYASLNARNNFL